VGRGYADKGKAKAHVYPGSKGFEFEGNESLVMVKGDDDFVFLAEFFSRQALALLLGEELISEALMEKITGLAPLGLFTPQRSRK